MHADVKTLYRSPSFRVLDYRCRMEPDSVSHPEYASTYSISFVRKGRFGYRMHKEAWDIDSRFVLLSNSGSEYVFTHGRDVSDVCTVVDVAEDILDDAERTYRREQYRPKERVGTADRFLFPAPLMTSSPDLDVVHRSLYGMAGGAGPTSGRLGTDELLVHLIDSVFRSTYGWTREEEPPRLDTRLLRRHVETVERAKDFMLTNFEEDLTLDQIAGAAWVSPFHFSRLFKRISGYSAFEYLIRVRLSHAAMLLRHTQATVSEVCFASGFNGLSHFSNSFSRRFDKSPSAYRSN